MIGDPYYLVWILLSLLALNSTNTAVSVLCIAMAVLTKPQALAFWPLIGFWILTRPAPKATAAGVALAAAVALAALAPFFSAGTASDVPVALVTMMNRFPFIHVNADNFWHLASGATYPNRRRGPFDYEPVLGSLATYRDLGLIAFGALNVVLAGLLAGRRSARSLIAGAATVALGFFMLNTRMHVNYSFPTLAFLSMLCTLREPRYRMILAMVSFSMIVDWNVFDQALAELGPVAVAWSHRINAGVYVAAFVALLVTAIGTIRREPRVAVRGGE